MSKKDARRVSVIESLLENKITISEAAQLCNLSTSQVMRLKKKARENGIYCVLHGNRDRQPKHAKSTKFKESIINLYKEKYFDCNFNNFPSVLNSIEPNKIKYLKGEKTTTCVSL